MGSIDDRDAPEQLRPKQQRYFHRVAHPLV